MSSSLSTVCLGSESNRLCPRRGFIHRPATHLQKFTIKLQKFTDHNQTLFLRQILNYIICGGYVTGMFWMGTAQVFMTPILLFHLPMDCHAQMNQSNPALTQTGLKKAAYLLVSLCCRRVRWGQSTSTYLCQILILLRAHILTRFVLQERVSWV